MIRPIRAQSTRCPTRGGVSRRASARRVPIAGAVIAILVGAAHASAAETTVTFESLAPGTVVTTQFQDAGGTGQGVIIGRTPSGAICCAYARVGEVPAGTTTSGIRVLSISEGSGEFARYGIWGRFPGGGKRLVRVSIGAAGGLAGTAHLVGVGLNGADLPGVAAAAPVPTTGQYTTPLQITDAQARIAFFRLVVQNQTAPGTPSPGYLHKIDDLTFDVPDPGTVPSPDFGLVLDQNPLTVPVTVSRGRTSQFPARVTVNRLSGSSGPLTPSVTGLPAGVQPVFGYDNPANPGLVTVALKAAANAKAASGAMTLTATPATPASGAAPRSVAIPFTVVEDYDLAVTGIDVTQGIQVAGDLPKAAEPGSVLPPLRTYDGLTLVSSKTTAARVHAVVAAPSGAKVKATILLHGIRSGGGALPGSPLTIAGWPLASCDPQITGEQPLCNPQVVTEQARTASSKEVATFILPPEWTKPGKIVLRAEVIPPTVLGGGPIECTAPTCAGNNQYALTGIPFVDTGWVNILALRFKSKGEPFPGFPDWYFAPTEQLLPIADGGLHRIDDWRSEVDVTHLAQSQTYQDYYGPGCELLLFSATTCAATMPNKFIQRTLMTEVEDFDDGEACGTLFPSRNSSCRDIVAGVATGQIAGRVDGLSRGSIFGLGGFNVVTVTRRLTSIAHETGHAMGVEHASAGCGGGSGGEDADTSWPDAWGLIRGIGWDRRDGRTLIAGTGGGNKQCATDEGAPPNSWFDFMSYSASEPASTLTGAAPAGSGIPADGWGLGSAWISTRDWSILRDNLRLHAVMQKRAKSVAVNGRPSPALRVRGFLMEEGFVALTRVGPVVAATPPPAASAYRAVLRDAAGASLGEALLAETRSHGHGANDLYLSGDVPLASAAAGGLPTALASVEVWNGSTRLAARRRSAHRPTVRILGPARGSRVGAGRTVTIRWRARDADGDALEAWVGFSADGGRSWRTIWNGPGTGRVSVPSTLLSASSRARLRVRVSDGFDEAVSVSPTFVAVGRRPRVRILVPAPRTVFTAGGRVALTALAHDDALRTLPGRGLTWFVDGRPAGRGNDRSIAGLRPGWHVIVARARDRLGRTGQASVRIRVLPVAPRLILRGAPAQVPAAATVVRLRLAATVPAAVSVSGPSVAVRSRHRIGTAARTITVRIRRGAGPVRITLRATAFGRSSTLAVTLQRA